MIVAGVQVHESARRMIARKEAMHRGVFYRLLPTLRARAFTVSGVEHMHTIERVQQLVAKSAELEDWKSLKAKIAKQLRDDLEEQAEARAQLLIRVHAFVAFQASLWRSTQEDPVVTHYQYLATPDERVRANHQALDGLVLPKDDPFWRDHYPPWEWGCRCKIRPLTENLLKDIEAADAQRPPQEQLIVSGQRREQLQQGFLRRGREVYDLRPDKETGFTWDPGSLNLDIDDILEPYSPGQRRAFTSWARRTEYLPGRTVWQWLSG